jgi:hypothetical protein
LSFGLKETGEEGSYPIAGDVGQLLFKAVVDALGIGFQGIVGTARPAVEIDAASGAFDGQRLAATAAALLLAVHDRSFPRALWRPVLLMGRER